MSHSNITYSDFLSTFHADAPSHENSGATPCCVPLDASPLLIASPQITFWQRRHVHIPVCTREGHKTHLWNVCQQKER